jgi:hypothetical protein
MLDITHITKLDTESTPDLLEKEPVVEDLTLTKINTNNLKIPFPKFEYCGCWIAGGCIRSSILNEQWSDIDVFGPTDMLDEFVKTNLLNAKQVHKSKLMSTYKLEGNKIQVIYREYDSMPECLNSFDYTITQFAFDGSHLWCNPDALIHLFERRLVVHRIHPEFAIDSLRRMQKYIKKGFSICDGGITDLVNGIRTLTDEQVKEQVTFYPGGGMRIGRFD